MSVASDTTFCVLILVGAAGLVYVAVSCAFEIGPVGRAAKRENERCIESFWQQREAKYRAAGFCIERMTAHDSLVLIRADGERFLVTFRYGETSSTSVVPLTKQTSEEMKP